MLAAKLGKTEGEVLSMSAREFAKWQIFAAMQPDDLSWWPRYNVQNHNPTMEEIRAAINGNHD